MKRLLIILVILFPGLVYAGPSIKFESDQHDFGTVRQGDFLEFSFEFTNTGTEDLLIKRLNPSWGCIAEMASPSHIKPNAKGNITLKVNTADRKGLIVENVEVISNDPLRTQIILTIQAYVMDVDMPLFPKWTYMFLTRKHLRKDLEVQEVHDTLRALMQKGYIIETEDPAGWRILEAAYTICLATSTP